jgi:CheY-like chemotaxis protein
MGVSVLVVDDDPGFLALATRVLRELGAGAVATAPDGASAMRAAEATRPDAVLVDVGLPDRDGLELAVAIAAQPWRPRVVLTSTDDAIAPAAARSGLPFVAKEDLAGPELRRLLLTG